MADEDAKARAEWLKPYRKVLMFPATSISIEVTGREQPMCKQIAEAIDIMVTFMLCNKIHGNSKKAMQACARELMKRVKDRHNYHFLLEVSKAWLKVNSYLFILIISALYVAHALVEIYE